MAQYLALAASAVSLVTPGVQGKEGAASSLRNSSTMGMSSFSVGVGTQRILYSFSTFKYVCRKLHVFLLQIDLHSSLPCNFYIMYSCWIDPRCLFSIRSET